MSPCSRAVFPRIFKSAIIMFVFVFSRHQTQLENIVNMQLWLIITCHIIDTANLQQLCLILLVLYFYLFSGRCFIVLLFV